MKKIMMVIGTRPDIIKMSPLAAELKHCGEVRIVFSGQHSDLALTLTESLGIRPHVNLGAAGDVSSSADLPAAVIRGMSGAIRDFRPDLVLVHGDTATAFGAAVAAYYEGVPVGHVEAGLRTYNTNEPFPEEFNRRAISLISSYDFAPTAAAYDNLIAEGKDSSRVFLTGNTVTDAARSQYSDVFTHPVLEWANGRRLLLVTSHRRENIGQPMYRSLSAIRRIADERPDVCVLFPAHPNGRVREIAHKAFDGCDRIRITEPFDYRDFINIEARCHLCVTDSGGIQEEAPAFGKPVLVMRNTTERPEGIDAGVSAIVGTTYESVYSGVASVLDSPSEYARMARIAQLYGDGNASRKIAGIIADIMAC